MKKKIFLIYILIININIFAMTKTNEQFQEFSRFRLNDYDFKTSKNISSLLKNGTEIWFYYKIDTNKKNAFITEFYYVFFNSKHEKYILGGFNKNIGFFDDKKNPLIETESDKQFRNKYLLGVSLLTIRNPFSIKCVALDTDGYIYETEVLKRLCINVENKSIEEYKLEI